MQNVTAMGRWQRLRRLSPVWLVPLLTVLAGAGVLIYHLEQQGPEVVLVASQAEGIEAGKTVLRSRSVVVGTVSSVMLTDDLKGVRIIAQLSADNRNALRNDSVFWVVKPQIGRSGVSGLDTLLSGAYIELQPGTSGTAKSVYPLSDTPPLASPGAQGKRIVLDSEASSQLSPGDVVLYKGYEVGSVESRSFDVQQKRTRYRLFIRAPYDHLVTSGVRFWQTSGVAFDMSAQGMRVEMGSLATLFTGGVSFDVPTGDVSGDEVAPETTFTLYENESQTQESRYNTQTQEYVLLFKDSLRGLSPGAPVEFRGVRLGTVMQVPFAMHDMRQSALTTDFRLPVLVRIEPARIAALKADEMHLGAQLQAAAQNKGLRAVLKTGNLLTGALYVDVDFYPQTPAWQGPTQLGGRPVLPTVSGGLAQLQQKLLMTLDKINGLPLEPMLTQTTRTLNEGQRTLKQLQQTLSTLNTIMENPAMKTLPAQMQATLQSLSHTLAGIAPASPGYDNSTAMLKQLDRTLRELTPLLKTLNGKSNALVFEADGVQDPQPAKERIR